MRSRDWFVMYGLALSALATSAGCGGAPTIDLRSWTLRIDGRGPGDQPVELPAHLDRELGARPGRYTLATRVALPAGFAGRPLTLTFASLPAVATLTANGEPCTELDPAVSGSYRGAGPLSFRIPTSATATGDLRLELVVEHRWIQSGWIDAVPRLSATVAGDASFLVTKYVARASHLAALVCFLGVALTSTLLTRGPKHRRAHAFLALGCLVGTAYPAFLLGLLTQVVGTWDGVVICVTVPLSTAFGLETFSAFFGSGPVHRGFYVAIAANAVLAVWLGGPFGLNRFQTPLSGALTMAIVAATISRLIAARRRTPRPPNVDVFLATMVAVMVCGAIDLVAFMAWWLPLPGWMHGLRVSSFGLVAYSIGPSVALVRDLIHSLQAADRLAAERAEQMMVLAAQNAEIHGLNDELRRQIVERSRDLGEALRRLEGAPAGLAIGEVIDQRYRVLRSIGQGGMGQVYEAERAHDQRRVALKVLVARSSHTDLARFAREAQLTTMVAHANLVSVIDVGIVPSRFLYLVMELIAGGSLEDQRPRFGASAWATAVLAQIADGLAAIHAAGIVHRDLKPANVLVVPVEAGAAPAIKIADFGIATLRGLDPARSGPISGLEATLAGTDDDALARLTETGTILGTPLYMAPELARRGCEPGPAADLYSLGLLAHELLTARYPFEVPPVFAVLRGAAAPAPPRLPRIPGLSPEALELLDRCLAEDPAERPSAAELARALVKVSRGEVAST